MNLIKYVVIVLLLIGCVCCGKLKLIAFKRPHAAFIGLKVRTPKFLGLKHGFGGGGGFGHGLHGLHGGFGGGHHHSSGYEHHEYHHESHHSSGGYGGGFGDWWGK